MLGTVIRSTGSWYDVMTDDGRRVQCKVKGNFRLRGIRSTNPVAIGDRVSIREDDAGAAFICDIGDRRNYIVRRASNLSKQSHILAANLDLALLVVTVARPETSTTFIDRFLAGAEAYRIPVAIAFNKTDDLTPEERQLQDYLTLVYRDIGYDVLHLSARTGEGLDALRPMLKDRLTLLAGHSGVGKSTLLNALIPGVNARTAEISEAYGTGTHTTTYSERFELPFGGGLIDIPGIKGFGTFDVERAEASHYFRELFKIGRDCRFSDCTHTGEPGCAVIEALEQHRLAPSRYQSYLSLLNDQDESKYREAQ